MTAVFELGDGTLKRFTRVVQGSSSEHRINGEVTNFNLIFFVSVMQVAISSRIIRNQVFYDVSYRSVLYLHNIF